MKPRSTHALIPAALLTVALAAGCTTTGQEPGQGLASPAASLTSPMAAPARPDHIVVAVFENQAAISVDNATAPYLTSLMTESAVLTDSHGIAHPSQPNYLALFSGSHQDVFSDKCFDPLVGQPNLGSQLIEAGKTFVGYSEGLPYPGFTGCKHERYVAKHNPWVHFANLPASVNQPFTAFPDDFTKLPTVAFVVPDMCADMHDCPISTGDAWARTHLDAYARWASAHNSLLIVTFDEDDNRRDNHILTFVAGAGVRPGRYAGRVTHYSVLALIEDLYGLARLGHAASAPPMPAIWL